MPITVTDGMLQAALDAYSPHTACQPDRERLRRAIAAALATAAKSA